MNFFVKNEVDMRRHCGDANDVIAQAALQTPLRSWFVDHTKARETIEALQEH